MHVQMFTQQHLRMQGKIDTIVLRTVERAGHVERGTGLRWGTHGVSGSIGGAQRMRPRYTP